MAAAFAAIVFARDVRAQFNGDFEIRHTSLSEENFLDWKSYQFSAPWRYDWYTARNGMRAAVGSLNSSRFYFQHDIKLMAELGSHAAFLYSQENESFSRDDGVYQEAELRIGRGLHVSLLGWVEPEKRFDNIGGALAWGGREDWDLVRLTYLRQYAQYNERRTRAARVEGRYERTPDLYRLEARTFWQRRLFVALEAKQETEAEFEEFETGIVRRYEGEELNATADWWGPGGDWLAGVSVSGDRERRQQSAAQDPFAPDLRQQLEWRSWDLHAWTRLAVGDELSAGVAGNEFTNRISSGDEARRFENRLATTQAYAQWEASPNEWLHGLFSVQAGDVNRTLKGDTGLDEDPGSGSSIQAKGGAGLVLREVERYRFLFLTTWDLDAFTDGPWDGGSIQLQILF